MFNEGIFSVVFKFIEDIPSQSLSIRSYFGLLLVPIFLNKAKEDVGFPFTL